MIIAVNMKNYKFGAGRFTCSMQGFGMLDTDTDQFVSMDGRVPYVLRTKKIVEGCIAAGWPEQIRLRVSHR